MSLNPIDGNGTMDLDDYFTEEEISKILNEQLYRCMVGTTRVFYDREPNYAILSFVLITGARASVI